MPVPAVRWANQHGPTVQKLYQYAMCFCANDRVVKRIILPHAVRVYELFKSRVDLWWKSDRGRPHAPLFSPEQALQLGILKALKYADRAQCHDPAWPVIRYLAALVDESLWKGPRFLAVAIGSLLYGAKPRSVALLSQNFGPESSLVYGDVGSVKASVHGQLRKTVRGLIMYDERGAPRTVRVAKAPGDVVSQLLELMIPWGTPHSGSPANHREYLMRGTGGGSWHVATAHLWLDQGNCFKRAQHHWGLVGEFDHWNLPIPLNPQFEPNPIWVRKPPPPPPSKLQLMSLISRHESLGCPPCR